MAQAGMQGGTHMTRKVVFSLVLVVSLVAWGSALVTAQELLRPERNASGTLVNQDYYTVDHHQETLDLLRLVETAHFSQQMFENFRTGQYRGVLGDLKYVLVRIANHPGALSMLGTTAILMKAPNIPIPFYEKALGLYPQYSTTHALYGNFLTQIEHADKGIAHLREAIRLDPGLPSAHAWLAEAYFKQRKPDLAHQEAEKARELGFPGDIQGEKGSGKSRG